MSQASLICQPTFRRVEFELPRERAHGCSAVHRSYFPTSCHMISIQTHRCRNHKADVLSSWFQNPAMTKNAEKHQIAPIAPISRTITLCGAAPSTKNVVCSANTHLRGHPKTDFVFHLQSLLAPDFSLPLPSPFWADWIHSANQGTRIAITILQRVNV